MARTFRKSTCPISRRSRIILKQFGKVIERTKQGRYWFLHFVLWMGNFSKTLSHAQVLGKAQIDGKGGVVPSRMKRDWNRWYRRTNKYRLSKDGEDFVGRTVRKTHIWERT